MINELLNTSANWTACNSARLQQVESSMEMARTISDTTCGWPANLGLIIELRRKILTFRDIIDLPPCDTSGPLRELIAGTIEDLQWLYPYIGLCNRYSQTNQSSINQELIRFYNALYAIGNSWGASPLLNTKEAEESLENSDMDTLGRRVITKLNSMISIAKEMFDLMDEDEQTTEDGTLGFAFGDVLRESFSDKKSSMYPSFLDSPTPFSPRPPLTWGLDYMQSSFSNLLPLGMNLLDNLWNMDMSHDGASINRPVAVGTSSGQGSILKEVSDGTTNDRKRKIQEIAEESPAKSSLSRLNESMCIENSGNLGLGLIPEARESEVVVHLPPPPQPPLLINEPSVVEPALTITAPMEESTSPPPSPQPPPASTLTNTIPDEITAPSPSPQSELVFVPPPPPPPLGGSRLTNTIPNEITTPSPFPQSELVLAPSQPPPLGGSTLTNTIPVEITAPSPSPRSELVLAPPPPPLGGSTLTNTIPDEITAPSPSPQSELVLAPSQPPPPPLGGSTLRNTIPDEITAPSPSPRSELVLAASPPIPKRVGGGGGGGPPPPPPLGSTKALRPKKSNTKLKRSSNMGNLYRHLKGKVEGSSDNLKLSKAKKAKIGGGGGADGGKKGMADALAEMTKRSSYFLQIEADVQNHGKLVLETKAAITSFQAKDMNELLIFQKKVEENLEKLTDESQVLARFEEFPVKKLESLRAAAALYKKLDGISKELANWKVEPPLNKLLDKAESNFNKIKAYIETLDRSKDEDSKKFQSHNINFDFNILVRIKEQIVDASSSCMELALKDRRDAKAAYEADMGPKTEGRSKECVRMLWRAFQLAFRVYSFAGGQDDRADKLSKELADEIDSDPHDV